MILEPGPMPLYYQLEQALKERIQQNNFRPGDLLPTEETLCETYGVSRTTVRRALDSLLAQRVIARRRGVGTFVAQPPDSARSMRLMGSLDELLTYPGALSYRALSRTEAPPPPAIARALDLPDSAKAVRLEVIGYLDRKPFAYSEFYFPDWVGTMIGKADAKVGLPIIRIVEQKISQRIVRAEQIVEPTLANGVTAKHLALKPKTPLLEVVRTYYVASGKPVEVAVVRYHPDRYRYTVELVTHPA
ncbi:MAG: GntR family transcriptional regulator [Bradyrhizobiaceae bacterium]|nr:GntR family transcriptional regulator [Bradyrhizobiaceae bacterium]